MFRRIIALVALAGLTVLSWGQDSSVYTDLQVMGRGEVRDGGLPNADDPSQDRSAFILSRSRLVVGYVRPELEVKTSLQHSGVWGQGGTSSFNVHEAWVKINAPFGLFTQIGRQALSYDDERIIGPNDWNMVGTTHDVIRAGWEGYGHKFHVAGAFNQTPDNINGGGTYYAGGSSPYKTMQLAWYHYDIPVAPIGLSLIFLKMGMQAGTKGDAERVEWPQASGGYV